MNKRAAYKIGKSLFPEATPCEPVIFGGFGTGAAVIALLGSNDVVVLYHPEDLKRCINMCSMALNVQGQHYIPLDSRKLIRKVKNKQLKKEK